MTVDELIARLEDCDPVAEVRLAVQPSWPLQWPVAGVAEHENNAGRKIAYIVQSDEHPDDDSPYAPAELFAHASI